ncbi:MAG: hypothetical protein QOE62_2633 [Actinomycetota bacterium]|nr:hypothetical protein [Actinomycetota bacterium]
MTDAPPYLAGTESHLTLHQRLAISACIAGLCLWIRAVEVALGARRR